MTVSTDNEDLAERIARLERRVARERQARRDAEIIAERGIGDLFEQQRRLALIQSVADAANRMDDPADAFRFALQQICGFTGWTTGHVWMFPDEDGDGALVSSHVWHPESDTDSPFHIQSRAMRFPIGLGLPGRVLESGRAIWVEDVTRDTNFPRAETALQSGLRGGFAFPALIGDEVAAVLEFFQTRPAPPDAELLIVLEQIGAQLGRVIERHRAARRLQQHNRELAAQRDAAEQASRAKSTFLAVTSHEIRTPLNAVLGLAEALKREPLTERQHELNDGVLTSGQMLLRLLNAVLDMSRIEADEATVRLANFDLPQKLMSVIGIWTPRAQELGVSLSLDQAALGVGFIRTDEGRIEQTLVNLIANALKFTPAGCMYHRPTPSSGSRSSTAVPASPRPTVSASSSRSSRPRRVDRPAAPVWASRSAAATFDCWAVRSAPTVIRWTGAASGSPARW